MHELPPFAYHGTLEEKREKREEREERRERREKRENNKERNMSTQQKTMQLLKRRDLKIKNKKTTKTIRTAGVVC